MIRNTLKILFISCFLQAQETEVIKKTAVYPTPRVDKKSATGQLFPGAKVIKLKKDRSGKFIKATLEFYIPIESLEEGRVALAVGEDQLADNAKFQLISADKDGKRIKLKLKVSNVHKSKVSRVLRPRIFFDYLKYLFTFFCHPEFFSGKLFDIFVIRFQPVFFALKMYPLFPKFIDLSLNFRSLVL